MDQTRNYGMQAITALGQCGEGIALNRKIYTKVDSDCGSDYAIGILIDVVHDGHCLRSHIGAETLYNISATDILMKYCAQDLIEDQNELKLLVKSIEDKWIHKVAAHYDNNPLTPSEIEHLSKSEIDYIQHHPTYLYKCMATIVIENASGAAVIHIGNAHPLFIYEASFSPMLHPQNVTRSLGDLENDKDGFYFESIPLSHPRTIAIVNDSLYRAMPANYLTDIYKLLGYYPELAEQYIQSQMPLLSANVNNEDLGIVVLFDQDPIDQRYNHTNHE